MRDKPMLPMDANLRSLAHTSGGRRAAEPAHTVFWSWWDGVEADRAERQQHARNQRASALLASRTPIQLWPLRCAAVPTSPPPCLDDLAFGEPCPAPGCCGTMGLAEPCTCSTSPHPPCGSCESGELVCSECDLAINTRE